MRVRSIKDYRDSPMDMSLSARGRLAALTVVWLACCSAAQAHHSFAMFDANQERTLSGTVKEFQWTNPHTFIWLAVPAGGGGAANEWAIEGMSPNYLGRRGWSKDTLKPGYQVTIVIHPLKDGSKGGTFTRMTLADGKVMDMFGGAAGGTTGGVPK
jgi:Family of unknown function (DUF6152)